MAKKRTFEENIEENNNDKMIVKILSLENGLRQYDDIDFIIWEVVNYCRRLMELPEVDYKDVWNYIDERFLEEMKRRGYTERQIEKEKEQRHAIFKELGDNYIEPLWLNPNLQEEEGEEEDV